MMRIASAFLVLALASTPGYAQVNTLQADNPREDASLRLGPFYVTPRLELREFGVDTNVFNASGERQSDFTFTVAPIATVWMPIARRGLVKMNMGSDLVWYKEFASERSIDPFGSVRAEAYLRRFTLFGEGSLVSSRQRPSFEIDLRSRRQEQAFAAGVDTRLTPKFSVELRGSRSATEFDGDTEYFGTSLAEVLNRTTTGFGTVARFRPTVLTTIALRAERFEDRFPLSPARDTDNVRVMPGVEFEPRALVKGHAFAGFRHLNPVDESVLPEFSGFVSDLGLSYTLLGATTLSLTHTRDARYSYEPLQPYYIDTGTGLSVRRALGPRFDVLVSATRNTYGYRDLIDDAVAAEAERIDTIWNYGGSVGYRLGRDGRVGLGATYWRRDSTTRSFRDYDGLRIGTTATYGF